MLIYPNAFYLISYICFYLFLKCVLLITLSHACGIKSTVCLALHYPKWSDNDRA